MKKLTLILFLFLCGTINAQETYSRVKIYCDNTDLVDIANLGVNLDHGHGKANIWYIAEISQTDIQKLEDNGYVYEVLIRDMTEYYQMRNEDPNYDNENGAARTVCPDNGSSGFDPPAPANFNLGGMAGYYEYQEFLDDLDLMYSLYPNLITQKEGISPDTLSWEGRPIYWVKISDNPTVDESEPEVLYTALHHAREPLSLSQLMYYMWYLLENYGTNDEVTFLVDNTELYFVPMINPDGYVENETSFPGGGGMHRKNKNPSVGTTNPGVDLNRNYAYHWNESGTSPNQNDDTYAGSGPFSEPETQCIKKFCEIHEFKFAFNNHTHGDQLLFPMGWADADFAPDHDYFDQYSSEMRRFNGFENIKSSDLYPAAGDSDDWMYIDDLGTKDTIFAMTPEIGDDFWPPSSAILPTCNEMMYPNLVLAHLPHVFGVTRDLSPNQIDVTTGYFNYEIERLGLTNGDLTVSITPLAGIQSVGGSNVHTLSIQDIEDDSISFILNSGIAFGDEIKYILHTDNGSWVRNDTITKSFGSGTPVFNDDCSDMTWWTGDWDVTTEDYVSPNKSMTDSPFSNYGNNASDECEIAQSFDLTGATYAYAQFNAKWEIENNYDYVEFMISTNGGSSWTPLCGNYTNAGTNNQDLDEPLYDGFQSDWVVEQVDLVDYLGNSDCIFRFLLISDGWVREDGFYFDDFQIVTDAQFDEIKENTIDNISVYPNPANNVLTIKLGNAESVSNIIVVNELGQPVMTVKPNGTITQLPVDGLAEGVYFVQIIGTKEEVITKRFTILR